MSRTAKATVAVLAAAVLATLAPRASADAAADARGAVLDQAFGYAFGACEAGLSGATAPSSALSTFEMNITSAKSVGEKHWPATFRGKNVQETIATCRRELPKAEAKTQEAAKAKVAAEQQKAATEEANKAFAQTLTRCKAVLEWKPGPTDTTAGSVFSQVKYLRTTFDETKAWAAPKIKNLPLQPVDGKPAKAALASCEADVGKRFAAAERAFLAEKQAKEQKAAAEKAAYDKEVAALRGDRVRVFKEFGRPGYVGPRLSTASRWEYTEYVSTDDESPEYRCTRIFLFEGDKLKKAFKEGIGCHI